ncbi:MAG: class I SAM-dependent DNA methyltransferase [Methanocorpusculum parvum]|nr:class I SAM-dependent DNA methyltransferase [Methanocorpusculum parvum]
MTLSRDQMKSNALAFSRKWRDAGDEKSEAQSFLNAFFDVFGFDRKLLATFENRVPLGGGSTGFIDLLWKGKLLVEMKSRGKNLDMAFSQAKNYVERLPERERPIFVMVCDFAKIRLYDLTKGIGADEYHEFEVSSLSRNIHHFAKILDFDDVVPDRGDFDEKVNVKAATMMAHLHESMESMVFSSHELQVYLVRILFCLFAEDAGIFEKFSFENYVKASREDGGDLAGRLSALFEVLDMPVDKRPAGMPDELRGFPYVNGKLFSETLHTAYLNDKVRTEILKCCNFDWDYISPAVFGAMFQGVMNPEERREAGAHYTSEENILKVIKPLFLDNLWAEFGRVKHSQTALERFHDMLSSLKFLDPACGCGNFLIIAYRELRKLEFEVIKILHPVKKGQFLLDCGDYAKVNVNQFYGIEYEEFPSQIAQVGMWLLDHQWNRILSEYYGFPFTRLPLTKSATIIHGNALRTDWEELVPRSELSYIMGNPPFIGYSLQSDEQKEDMLSTYVDEKGKVCRGAGKIDYVSAWYYKAAKYMQGTRIRTAFVSTNSITQGEQVAFIWKPLYEMFGATINFGYRTFKWSNEAKGKAAVHCVIIGFDTIGDINTLRFIFDEKGIKHVAQNISPYLLDTPTVFVESRTKPLCDVPLMLSGSKPADGGHLILSEEEYQEFVDREPQALKYIKKFSMGNEFINNINRYCLWLVDCSPAELRKMPLVMERVKGVREFREASKKAATRKKANTPTLFDDVRCSSENFVVIPKVSSEAREYVPIGFLTPDTIAGDKLFVIRGVSLYHFGVLTSNIHMAWMRVVCGRLEMRYSYSNTVVYNNFPFPTPTEEQKSAIEKTAQGILDARALYPDSSLADLYDPLTMPPELRKAHEANDKAVEKAYGRKFADEGEIVAYLMQEYQRLVSEKK